MQVIKYTGLESRAIDARKIQIVFKKGEKLELALDKEVTTFKIKVYIPGSNSNYLLQQYALSQEEKARKDFEKYSEKLESGKYALHIIPTCDQPRAELVLNRNPTLLIQRKIKGNNY